jgi:hypothetical protein
MVNADMVNGKISCSPLATFCEILRILGRFRRSQNPIKYIRNSQINSKTGRLARGASWMFEQRRRNRGEPAPKAPLTLFS